jgi:hypothetical protein
MARTNKQRDAFGGEARDGERIAVNLLMCDSHPRRWPGYAVPLTDAEAALHRSGFRTGTNQAAHDAARSSREAWIKDMSEAWRGPGSMSSSGYIDARRKPPDDPDDDPDDDDDEDRENRDRHPSLKSLADIRRPAIEAREAWVRSCGRPHPRQTRR